jgi:hypothetical protein
LAFGTAVVGLFDRDNAYAELLEEALVNHAVLLISGKPGKVGYDDGVERFWLLSTVRDHLKESWAIVDCSGSCLVLVYAGQACIGLVREVGDTGRLGLDRIGHVLGIAGDPGVTH